MRKIKEITEYKDMIGGLVKRELRGRYKGSFLGYIWNFLNPLCQIVVYMVVFSQVFRTGIDHYYVYLLVGIIPWNFLAECLNQGSGCVFSEADMVKKIYFPREVLPIAVVISRLINFLISFTIVMIVIEVTGFKLEIRLIPWLLLTILLEFIFALGLTLLLSAINVYFRDIQYMVGVFMMALIWAAPIMYSVESIEEPLRTIIMFNPFTHFAEMFHSILYYRCAPSLLSTGVVTVCAILALTIGELVFAKAETNFAEEL